MMENEKIPHFINDPTINRLTAPENKLMRPKINLARAVLCTVIFFCICILITLVAISVLQKRFIFAFDLFSKFFPVVFLIMLVFCLRFVLIWFIRLYQRFAKSETRLRCCFIPSCSEYAILAIKKNGVFYGGLKSIRRLFRCHPPGGVDYP